MDYFDQAAQTARAQAATVEADRSLHLRAELKQLHGYTMQAHSDRDKLLNLLARCLEEIDPEWNEGRRDLFVESIKKEMKLIAYREES